jgi:hypothetical protein
LNPAIQEYDAKEASVQSMIASLLDQRLILDLSLTQKIMIATVWIASLLFTALFGLLSWKDL